MQKLFKGTSVEECLEKASKSLNLAKEEIKYEIIKEKSGFFKKEAIIEVIIDDIVLNINCDELNGKIKIENNKIIVTNPKEGGLAACIMVGEGLTLKVDGVIIGNKIDVFENSIIEVIFPEETPKRYLSITTSSDKMEAYMSIEYVTQNIYRLKDVESSNSIFLEKEIEAQIMPPIYKINEIKEELSKMGIIYGIIEENIKNNVEVKCNNILIAKGHAAIHGEDDAIEYRFPIDDNLMKIIEDDKGNVDYKNISSIKSVKENDIIAVVKEGKQGRNGKNILGNQIKHKEGKKVHLKVGEGCAHKDKNTVIATMEGKPCTKNNVFYVYKLHEVKSDIDLSTGNIKFIGDVVIHGSVKEGMEVKADNSISIRGNVDRALIQGKGDISISGNIISSDVVGGGEDVSKINYIDKLTAISKIVEAIIRATEEIKKYDIVSRNKKDGEIVKILIENKYKNLPKLCFQLIKDIKLNEDIEAEETIIPLIREKLLGLGPISIKGLQELHSLNFILKNKISLLKEELSLPVNVQINYCQDSRISSTGNIYINDIGSYISQIFANNSIYFTKENSVVRGGVLKGKDEIKCGIVGSVGGVTTKLIVGDNGHIWTKVAYQNTVFVVGQREYLLEIPSKDVHAYLDNKGELIVDRFIL